MRGVQFMVGNIAGILTMTVYRITLAESSMSGGIEQLLGRRCWRGNECLDSDLWGTGEPYGAGVYLQGWELEAVPGRGLRL